jgi:hypothetical protein
LQYERLYQVEPVITHLEGRCKCAKLVKANVSRVEAHLNESVCESLRMAMEGIFLQNTGNVFHSLYDELKAELELVATIAPLVVGSNFPLPPRRVAPASPGTSRAPPASPPPSSPRTRGGVVSPRRVAKAPSLQQQVRLVLFVINSLLDVIALAISSPSTVNACKGMVLAVCAGAYNGILKPVTFSSEAGAASALVEQQVQVKNLWRDFSRWVDVDSALRSAATLESEVSHIAHSFLLQRLIALGPSCSWAGNMLLPGIPQIVNRWLNEALLGGDKVRSEEVLLVAVSRFPVKEIANLTPETVQAFVMLPIQKALEFYADQGYFKLAIVLSKLLVAVAQYFPMLLSKCLAVLMLGSSKVLAVCSSFVHQLPWSVASDDDLEDLLGALLGTAPALRASEYANLSQTERMPFRVALMNRILHFQQELLSLEYTLSFHSDRFSPFLALGALIERLPVKSAFSGLIVQEIMFFCLYHVRPTSVLSAGLIKSLQQEALTLFEMIWDRLSIGQVGSCLVQMVSADLETRNIDAESIATLTGLPCFAEWAPTEADLKQFSRLTSHRVMDMHTDPGADRVDALVEQLLLSATVGADVSPEWRSWATRNGGQLMMGVNWGKGRYLPQVTAAMILLSSKLIGMPSGWVVETLLSERAWFTNVQDALTESDLDIAERLLHLKCPQPILELEWRVLKIVVSIHLTSLHCSEVQSASGTGVYAKYDLAWLDSMGVITKTCGLLSGPAEFTQFSACQIVARISQVMILCGKSSSWSMITPLLDAFLQIPNIGFMAEKYVFAGSIVEATRYEEPYENGDVPSALSKTLQFWAECLGSLSGDRNAVRFLENVLHSATAAGQMHWPVLPNASFESALVWARNGKIFLAIAFAASIRPIVSDCSLLPAGSAVSALIELAVNVIQDKTLALLCWDVMHTLGSGSSSTWSLEQLDRISTSCSAIEKSFPLGNPARRAYATIVESLRRQKSLPATPVLADASVRRFLWSKFPPAYKIASKGKTGATSSLAPSSDASVPSGGVANSSATASTTANVASSAIQRYELPVAFLALVGSPSFVLSNTGVLDYCSRSAYAVSDTMLRMEVLEKDFIVACRSLYQVISSKATVSCGSMCKGGVEVSFDTMSQTADSLEGPLKNRHSFVAACSELWILAAKLAASAFVFNRASLTDQLVAEEFLGGVVSFCAEKMFPDHRPLVVIANEAIRACGRSVEVSLVLVRSFLKGCKRRFDGEEQGKVAEELHGDALLSRVDFLVSLLVAPESWTLSSHHALLLVHVVKDVFSSFDGLSGAEARRLLSGLGFETALQYLVSQDECLASLLKIVCHVLASPEWSVIFMRFLIEHHGLEDAVGVAVDANECWVTGIPREVAFRSVRVALTESDLSVNPPAWQTLWFDNVAAKDVASVDGAKVLKLLGRALGGRRKPAGLIAAVRKLLPMLVSSSAWSELDHILRVGALANESSLSETAVLICKCAPDTDTAVSAWLSWFSGQVCSVLPEDGIERVARSFELSWSQVSWSHLKAETLLAFLRETVRPGCTAVRRHFIFRSWEFFGKVDEKNDKIAAQKTLPALAWLFLLGLRKQSSADIAEAVGLCDWENITDAHVITLTSGNHAGLNPDFAAIGLSTLRGASGASKQDLGVVLEMLERVRDGCLKSTSDSLCLFWMSAAAKISPSVPTVLRLIVPLCRKVKNAEACKLLVSVCVNSKHSGEDAGKLKSVLQTFVSSLADPQLSLLMLQAIPAQVTNPRISAPLIEGLLHSYLACSKDNMSLELAARAWTPPSLPENSKSDFPIHDVAATTAPPGPGLALTLMLILERQRLVSPASDKAPTLWTDLFACPSLASLYMFPADPVRVFDLVGLWIWGLQSIVVHFRPSKHAELSRVIIDFISLLDDLSLGYNR